MIFESFKCSEQNSREDERTQLFQCSSLNYLKVKCLCEAFQQLFGLIFSVMFYNTLLCTIYLSFILIRSDSLPLLIIIPIFGADSILLNVGYLFSSLTTKSHLLTKEIISASTKSSHGIPLVRYKFWKSMKPFKAYAGQFCSFETKEFILFLGGEVVVKKIIDLLVAL